MEIREYVLLIALGCAGVTLPPRVLPLVLLARVALPPWLRIWLSQVPVAIMAALLAQELAIGGGRLLPLAHNAALLAILPVLLVAALTRSLIGAVAAGVASMALLRALAMA